MQHRSETISERYSPEDVRNFSDLSRFLDVHIGTLEVKPDNNFRMDGNKVKTYLVESAEGSILNWPASFRDKLRRTYENDLYLYQDKKLSIFLDLRDSRFILAHSVSPATETDKFISKYFAKSSSGFDRAWFPNSMLSTLHEVGIVRGFRYDTVRTIEGFVKTKTKQQLLESEQDQSIAKRDSLPIEMEYLPARPTMELTSANLIFRDSKGIDGITPSSLLPEYLQNQYSLDWVQHRVAASEGKDEINQTIYSNGKTTASGNSIQIHMYLSDRMRTLYGSAIREIEQSYSVGWQASSKGMIHKGQPLYIKFPDNLEVIEMPRFVRSIFRAAAPFRLFGVPTFRAANRCDVEAIDLHTGDPFSVEVSDKWLRIFLPVGSCGNILARLLVALQRSLDSGLELTSGQGDILLAGR